MVSKIISWVSGSALVAVAVLGAVPAEAAWTVSSSTALATETADQLGDALYEILQVVIPLAVAVGIFFFAYGWLKGIFSARR